MNCEFVYLVSVSRLNGYAKELTLTQIASSYDLMRSSIFFFFFYILTRPICERIQFVNLLFFNKNLN